jgi:hypothetical protein
LYSFFSDFKVFCFIFSRTTLGKTDKSYPSTGTLFFLFLYFSGKANSPSPHSSLQLHGASRSGPGDRSETPAQGKGYIYPGTVIGPPLFHEKSALQSIQNFFEKFRRLPLEMHAPLNCVKLPAPGATSRLLQNIHHSGMSTSQKKGPSETTLHQKGKIVFEGIRHHLSLLAHDLERRGVRNEGRIPSLSGNHQGVHSRQ